MTRVVVFHPEALAELQDAEAWYETQRPGLGADFLTDVNACIAAVCENPHSFPTAANEIRSARLKRFTPYSVYFETLGDDRLFVYAVFHASRDPAVWQNRIT